MPDIFEKDYIRRWRVLAMLNYIKFHLQDGNINTIVDNYIRFASEINEDEYEGESK